MGSKSDSLYTQNCNGPATPNRKVLKHARVQTLLTTGALAPEEALALLFLFLPLSFLPAPLPLSLLNSALRE